MAKIITDKEMGEIIHKATHDEGIIDCQDSYLHFLTELGQLIANHFGGDANEASYAEDTVGYCVAFNVNECVPSDGGVFKDYDPDIIWKDGEESERDA